VYSIVTGTKHWNLEVQTYLNLIFSSRQWIIRNSIQFLQQILTHIQSLACLWPQSSRSYTSVIALTGGWVYHVWNTFYVPCAFPFALHLLRWQFKEDFIPKLFLQPPKQWWAFFWKCELIWSIWRHDRFSCEKKNEILWTLTLQIVLGGKILRTQTTDKLAMDCIFPVSVHHRYLFWRCHYCSGQ